VSSLLRFEQVGLERGGRLLFEGLDLDLQPGGGLHLIGPNGSGKSSLIRLAAGLLRARSGRIERAELALADDSLALDRDLPLGRALAFWAGLRGRSAALGEAMDTLGLAPLAEVPVRLLSTGQARRAALARVAASGAPLWLLDEPLNGLDEDGLARLDTIVERHRQSAGAVLVASHRPLRGAWSELRLGA
jgi:heme exporter protein A